MSFKDRDMRAEVCIKMGEQPETWNNSYSICESRGGTLLILTTADDEGYLNESLTT